LAGGLLVSFTATAGNDRRAGEAAWSAVAPLVASAMPLPPSARLIEPSLDLPGLRGAALRFELPVPAPADFDAPPRDDLKATRGAYPAVDRSRKGDPVVALRPSLSRRAGDLAARPDASEASRMMFGVDERLPLSPLASGPVEPRDLEAEPKLEPWGDYPRTTTQAATAARSPQAAAAGSTGPGGGRTRAADGGTPSVPRALALSSTTPAAAEATPVVIAAAPVSLPPSSAVPRPEPGVSAAPKGDGPRSRYADLIDPDKLAREKRCLAEAVYFEARSEPEAGQAAVAQVVLNRVKSGLYPDSICGVVYQNRHRHLACQFTFACEGKALRVTESESWARATRVAKAVLEGSTYLEDVGGSTHYHANYVRPRWARKLKKMDKIGRHIFYKLRPGQT